MHRPTGTVDRTLAEYCNVLAEADRWVLMKLHGVKVPVCLSSIEPLEKPSPHLSFVIPTLCFVITAQHHHKRCTDGPLGWFPVKDHLDPTLAPLSVS